MTNTELKGPEGYRIRHVYGKAKEWGKLISGKSAKIDVYDGNEMESR